MDVVMVHGFYDTGRLFDGLGAALKTRGHAGHAPTFHPRDGRLGLPDLASKLAAYIEGNVGAQDPFALVGFSMGALVARHYIQEIAEKGRLRAFFSIAGPHAGTPTAYFYPGVGTGQMRPRSPFLRALGSWPDALRALPVHTYRTPFDLMVLPASTTRMPHGRERVVPCLFHSQLPGDRRVVAHIVTEIDRLDAVEPGRGAGISPP